MGRERGADFYDANLGRFLLPLERSPWRDLYERAVRLIPAEAKAVADIGCGTGRFARLVRRRCRASAYWGVDFAAGRVAEARRYEPDLAFSVGSVFDPAVQRRFADFDVFVLLEILEHLERDVELLAALPAGARVILSVPDYDSPAHVRFFEDADTVVRRYESLLDFEVGTRHVCVRRRSLLARLRGRRGQRIFLLSATRR